MGEHTNNIETFLSRRREIRREPEMRDHWRHEAFATNDTRDFEQFKNSKEWDTWREREMRRMDAEELAIRMLGDEVTKLRKRESLPDPTDSSLWLHDVPDFIKSDGSTAAENRWDLLKKECRAEIDRRSNDLDGVWGVTLGTAIQELKAEGKLSQDEIDNLENGFRKIWQELSTWDKALIEKPLPQKLAYGIWPGLLGEHKALLDKIDGAKSPTAKYKVLATIYAIGEMQARQRNSRQPPPSYSKMLDRMNEITGRQPVPQDVTHTFQRSKWYSENPHKVWQELITGAHAELFDQAKQQSPEFFEGFKALIGHRPPGEFRPAINYQRSVEALSTALEAWPAAQISWPATDEAFQAAHRIAWNIQVLKLSIDQGLAGTSDGARAIRARLHGVVDGLAERYSNQLARVQ